MVNKSACETQDAATQTWKKLKAEYIDKVVFEKKITEKITELEMSAKKKKASLMSFWCSVPLKKRCRSEVQHDNTTMLNTTDSKTGITNSLLSIILLICYPN